MGRKPVAKSITNLAVLPDYSSHLNQLDTIRMSCTSDTMDLGDDTQEYIKYIAKKQKGRHRNQKSKSRTRDKNILAYSLLDRSLDNTINMIESAKRKEKEDYDCCKYFIKSY